MNIKRALSLTGLRIQKYSPEILTVVGVVSFIGTVVMACKQTTKASEILDKYREEMDDIKEVERLSEEGTLIDDAGNHFEYTVEERRKDKFGVITRTTVSFAKLYSGPTFLGILSIGAFLSANEIIKKRYLGAVAAYNLVSSAFEKYRNRVIEEGGKELDRHYMYGTERGVITTTEIDENGKKTKVKEPQEIISKEEPAMLYAKFFDESCPDWDKNPDMNLAFLHGMENIATTLLHHNGHLFLNEVYDMLGIPRTAAGALVGWVDGMGDGYVDFGLGNGDDPNVRRFVNGYENVVLLDFNVDGIIYDKLDYLSEGTGNPSDIFDHPEWYKARRKKKL